MKILEKRKLEDCIDGSQIFRYRLDQVWSKSSIHELKKMGRLDYYPDFPRPFFRLCAAHGLQIKGVEGERDCQIFFPLQNREQAEAEIEKFFEVTETSI